MIYSDHIRTIDNDLYTQDVSCLEANPCENWQFKLFPFLSYPAVHATIPFFSMICVALYVEKHDS